VAPGNRIDSLLAKGSTLDVAYLALEVAPTTGHGSAQYFRLSGTSVATPLVSGAAALMLQKNPTLTPDAVKARIMKTAWKGFGIYSTAYDVRGNRYNDQYDIFTYGAGYLDVDAVLGNTDVASGSTLSPTAVYHSSTGTVTLVNTSGVTWAKSVIWNSSTSWADTVIWGNTINASSVIWGNSVVWGNTADAGYSVIWGTSVIWGNSTAPLSVGEDGEN
jgi:serine protease AprX